MTPQYADAARFRAALEARLANRARATETDVGRLRRRVAFERLLARLVANDADRWILKGGVVLELRLPDRARATLDLDLATRHAAIDAPALRNALAGALGADPTGDRFTFRVGEARALRADEAARPGARCPVEARLAGRVFAQVRVDVVARTEELRATEPLTVPTALAFAGFEPVVVEAVDRGQHFAEKLHSVTRTYGAGTNTRVKDLVDLVILIDDGLGPTADLAATVAHVFRVRATHPVPRELPDPPSHWDGAYQAAAAELDLPQRTLPEAVAHIRGFWARVPRSSGEP